MIQLHSAEVHIGYGWPGYFSLERLRLHLLLEFGRNEEDDSYLAAKIHNEELLRFAVKYFMNQRADYERVIELCMAAKVKAEFHAFDWDSYLFEAYKRAGMIIEQRVLARKQLLDGKLSYYDKLKESYSVNDWKFTYPEILEKLRPDLNRKVNIGSFIKIVRDEGE